MLPPSPNLQRSRLPARRSNIIRSRRWSDPMTRRRAIFLDRDGVLNQLRSGGPAGTSPRSVSETIIYPDVPDALATLRDAGFLLIVTTNQPDVARGRQTRAGV